MTDFHGDGRPINTALRQARILGPIAPGIITPLYETYLLITSPVLWLIPITRPSGARIWVPFRLDVHTRARVLSVQLRMLPEP